MPWVKKEPRDVLVQSERAFVAAGDTEASALGWLMGLGAMRFTAFSIAI